MNSSIRKRAISGWLKKHDAENFSSPLKLQKFLFFYEALSKMDNDKADFRTLKGYENGPVFSDVYGDYRYRKDGFSSLVEKTFTEYPQKVNKERAKIANFLVRILEEDELSKLTHQFNMWKSKENEISSQTSQVTLCEEDFNQNDV